MTGPPFKTIKLKKKAAGPAQTFASEIRTVQAAEPKTRAKLHWRLAASALAALDTGPVGQGTYDRANRQCATLWPPKAGWPTKWL